MTRNLPSIILKKMVLKGIRKDYIVKFHEGLNIIYGDSDTGKSSILNIINYCLGSKKVYTYDEIEYNVKYVFLELELNNHTYTIKRNIMDSKEFIYVYQANMEEIKEVFPAQYGSSFEKEGADGFFSDFLLRTLNIPIVKIRRAPTKVDSEMVRLSFRDVFKFCYLNQDDIGSRNLLDLQNGPVFTRNKETFKFINNVLDNNIVELQYTLKEKTEIKNKLIVKYDNIKDFFRETDMETADRLEIKLEEYNEEISHLNIRIEEIDKALTSDTEYLDQVRSLIIELKEDIEEISKKINTFNSYLNENLILSKAYSKDIKKIESTIEYKNVTDKYGKVQYVCPTCQEEIKLENESLRNIAQEMLEQEKKDLKRRKGNLEQLIDSQIQQINKLELLMSQKKDELSKSEILLDEKSKTVVSSVLLERDGLISYKNNIEQNRSKFEYIKKVNNQLKIIEQSIDINEEEIQELKKRIKELEELAPSIESITRVMGDELYEFLYYIKIKNCRDISISRRNFLPIVRGREYKDLTSGGLRTLVSIGYFFSLLNQSIEKVTNLPSFLMIDTIGKYIGKTQEKYISDTDGEEDKKENINDKDKYNNIYKYIINKLDIYEKNEKSVQVIVVDNDIPSEMEDLLQKYTIKKFSSVKRTGYEYGLIDDAYN